MGKCKLPIKDSNEAREIIKRVRAGGIGTLWRELGYASRDSLLSGLRHSYEFYISREPLEMQSMEAKLPEVKVLPVMLRESKAVKIGRGDPETQVVVIGDGHAGEITPSFNPDVYKERMGNLFKLLP